MLLRTGIVLSESGGALTAPGGAAVPSRGGRAADRRGRLAQLGGARRRGRAYVHAIVRTDVEGPFNLVAQEPVTAGTFARTLADVLHRPAAAVPGFGPALVLGRREQDP